MTGQRRVLVVEDDITIAESVAVRLRAEGFVVAVAHDGPSGVALAASFLPDLVVLDVMLPGIDGFSLAQRMREAGNYTPLLMLTAKSLPDDIVQGLSAGADDYLAKPFDLPVLLARVRGLLRRRDWTRGEVGSQPVRIGDAEVDFANFEVRARGETFRLTVLEATLLKLLVQNQGRVVSKGEILEKVWNLSPDTETRAVDNFIVRLRRYIEANPRFPNHLETVRGAGYRLTV
jgi:DNA-binding response OmpR family regulator